MKISRMAEKKIGRLQGFTNVDLFELDFKNQILFEGFEQNNLGVTVDKETLDIIIDRCEKYYVNLIGVEINLDSELPYYDFNYEDYTASPPGSDWCKEPIIELIQIHGPIPLIFHIDLSLTECIFLERLTKVPFAYTHKNNNTDSQ